MCLHCDDLMSTDLLSQGHARRHLRIPVQNQKGAQSGQPSRTDLEPGRLHAHTYDIAEHPCCKQTSVYKSKDAPTMCASKDHANGEAPEQSRVDPEIDQEWEARRARFHNVSSSSLH